LAGIVPAYILSEGNPDNTVISKKTFVISLSAIVVISSILLVFGINKNITSQETDKRISLIIEKLKPILNILFWATIISVFIYVSMSIWRLLNIHYKTI